MTTETAAKPSGFFHALLHQRLLVVLAAGVLAAAGWFAWQQLPIDAFPDVTSVQVMVLTDAPGMSPADVEQQVTFPIELAMQGIPRVTQVRSLSKAGLSQVSAIFEDAVDIYFARQLVLERLNAARESLPNGIEPELGPISTGLGEIYQYTLESPTRTPMELRTIQDWLVAPQLRTIPGVNEVNSFGGEVKQYHIEVDPAKLLKHGIALAQVAEAVERQNANAPGGFIVEGWEQSYVRSLGMAHGVADIENMVLTEVDGRPLFVRDVATVKLHPQTRTGAVTRDGKGEAVAGMVIMLRGANSKVVVDAVKEAIPRVQASLPKDVRLVPFYDRTSLIQACVRTVTNALLQGGIFVIAVLFLLLGNARGALTVAVSIPLTAAIAFLLMGWQGVTANLMSLGGLAIALGMIVDASIVVVENIARHLGEKHGSGLSRAAVIRGALEEVVRPIIFSVLIIVIVFLPLFTLEQMEGKMFKPLALTMCFAMAGSLVVALTIVPVLASLLIHGESATGPRGLVRLLLRGYLPVLNVALRFRKTIVVVAVAALALTLTLAGRLGTEFLPALDEGAIAINVVRLPSASLDGSVAAGSFMEQRLKVFPEIESVVTKTGRAEISEDPMGPEQNDLIIGLKPEREWTTGRTKADLVAAIQQELAVVPGVRLSFSQPIALRVNELISGVKSDVAVKLFGPDLDLVREHADRIAAAMGSLDGAGDVKVEQISGMPVVEVRLDRQRAARYGVDAGTVNETIETAMAGREVTIIQEGQMRFAAVVRFADRHRQDLPALQRLLIPASGGKSVPLSEIAAITRVEAPAQISREKGMRRVAVECNVRGRDLGGFVAELRGRMAPLLADLPTGYWVELGGQFENQQRAMQRLAVVVPVSIALIFILLFSALRSLRAALLILANLPFALVGGVVALVLLKANLSVSSVIGFICLFGVAVGNGTLLVTFFQQLRTQGLGLDEAVRRGCTLRFRPLLMTSMTTLLGLLPMIYATGSGAEIQRPLAAVVLGGLVSSLLLTLLVLPALYAMVENWFAGHPQAEPPA